MKNNKKSIIRKQFREAVFTRDGYRCRCCQTPGKDRQGDENWKKFHKIEPKVFLDAHHVQNRNLFDNGGYIVQNGISVCDECHLKAEKYHITEGREWEPGFHPNDLYLLINSSFEQALAADLKA